MDSAVVSGTIVLVLASAATYGWRLGGLALADRLPQTGRARRFLDALPGSLLVSLAAPELPAFGVPGALAGLAVVVSMKLSRSTLLAATVGVASIVGLRALA